MSFKTQAEIFEALLDGRKIIHDAGKGYVKLVNGQLVDVNGPVTAIGLTPQHWSIYEEPLCQNDTITPEVVFKVGDIVRVKPGLDCSTERDFTIGEIGNYPRGIKVYYTKSGYGFYSKYELEFVSRPKKKIKKTIWTNVYKRESDLFRNLSTYFSCGGYSSKEAAEMGKGNISDYVCTVSFEIEVEDDNEKK